MREQKAELLRDQRRPMALAAEAGAASGKRVVEAKGLTKAFGERVLIKGFSTRIQRGDRLAIVGPNGAGKTTLVKLLLGEIAPDDGDGEAGDRACEIAYVDQARDDLKADMTLWDALAPPGGDQVMVRGRPRHVAAYARDFLFQDSQLRQPVSSLSGGERNRLLLARALAQPANLLVLDEPTNDLDMETLDLLEDVLADYDGTLILVSHDRDFIDRLATSTIALDGNGRVGRDARRLEATSPARTRDFFELRARRRRRQAEAASPPPAMKARGQALLQGPAPAGRAGDADRQAPTEIAALEERLARPRPLRPRPRGFDKIMKDLDRLRARAGAAEDEWLALEEKREALANG